ncbi:hypothetical protein LPJ77_004315 [Coemansia sp. RSA 2523]|nr:hypothetical protein LPJ77_004315 [Coemansia sp. RSA 2523]
MHYKSLGLFSLLLTLVSSKSADIEFVQACDSSSDDVTNQCINRIPENIGAGTGNHACAYHEAEVRCLGLCGNTVTWKVAYTNALKRYRLVCASFIDERIAEKEEMGGEENAPKKQKQKPREEESETTEVVEKVVEKVEKVKKTKSEGEVKPTKSEKNKATAMQSKDVKPTGSAKAMTITVSIKTASNDGEDKSAHSARSKDTNKARALIPTMDPELADSASAPSLAISALFFLAATLF